jgi:hypothetical protein
MSFYVLKSKMQFCSFAVFLIFTSVLMAQTPTQTVRGRVVGFENNETLVGASVSLSGTKLMTLTDTFGIFKIENVPVGRYDLSVSFVGFKPYEMPDLWVQSGKEVVLDLKLSPSAQNLETFTTTSSRFGSQTALSINNSQDYLKYPANFNDPARMITYLPGAATDNDQGNNISVRGNTPNAMQWYLEGAEIVNPNHLSNAGTPSDRTTANGGGVLILGANMMESANFYKGALSADKGGALTSIMDLNLRRGNDSKRQSSVSLGLIGTEAGTEGYFSPPTPEGGDKSRNSPFGGRGASYLVHYRYSTIGLLSKMGIPLGDEAITYQDLTYNFNLPTQKAGNFNLFGMHGFSDNIFKNKPKKEWVTEKDSQDISFKNFMNVVGLKHSVGLSKKAIWNTVVAYSWLKNSRNAVGFDTSKTLVATENFENEQAKLFVKTKVDWQWKLGTWHIGTAIKNEDISYIQNQKKGGFSRANKISGQEYWLQPFVEWESHISESLQYHLGLRASVLSHRKQFTNRAKPTKYIEPSLGLQYNGRDNSVISLNFSVQSQTLSPTVNRVYQTTYSRVAYDTAFILSRSGNANLNFRFNVTNKISADFSAYYQVLSGPSIVGTGYVTAFDELETRFFLTQRGYNAKGRNIGFEVDINRSISKGYHWRLNMSIYDSKIGSSSLSSIFLRNSPYNGHYIINALAGKEWTVGKNQNKFWGINAHILLRGGFRETPIDETASKKANQMVYDYTKPFSLQLKDYFRTDLSVYFKRNRLKWSSTLQLDIQNLTNQRNEGWHYFDRFTKKVETKYQLGVIPNLSYKVDF